MDRRTFLATTTIMAATSAVAGAETTDQTDGGANPKPETGYVEVNGLRMYYESHGSGGVPLVLLHGAFSSIHNSFGSILPALSAGRRVIGFDFQAHGRTADIERPLRLDSLADDIVAAMDALEIENFDLLGYSTGAAVALLIAVHHPQRVRKLIPMSATYRLDGIRAGLMEGLGEMQPSMMYDTPWHTNYLELNPEPDFDALFRKKTEMDKNIEDLSDEQIAGLDQPVLLIAGDSDLPALEHMIHFFRLVGGDVFGDLPAGLPRSQLAILPGASHVTTPFQTEVLSVIVPAFLDKPMDSAD